MTVAPVEVMPVAERTAKLLAVPRFTSWAVAWQGRNVTASAKPRLMGIRFAAFRKAFNKSVSFMVRFLIPSLFAFGGSLHLKPRLCYGVNTP
jgi:hypothetical protein